MARRVSPRNPPFEVSLLAFLAAADGVVAIGQGLLQLGVLPLALFTLAVGALHLVAAYGLWETEPYAYPLGMTVFGVGVVTDLVSMNPVAAALSALNMYLLYRYRGLFR